MEVSVKLYGLSRASRRPIALFVALMGVSQGTRAATGREIDWDCPAFADDVESRAAVEARSRVELSLVNGENGHIIISCSGDTMRVVLRLQNADGALAAERSAFVPAQPDMSHNVDALVEAVWQLAHQPRAQQPPSRAPDRLAAPPVRARPAHLRLELALGGTMQALRGPVRGFAGPSCGVALRAHWGAVGLSGGYARGFSAAEGLRLTTWSAGLFGEMPALGPLWLGASAGGLWLGASAPADVSPRRGSLWVPELAMRARLRLQGARFSAALGPELHYRWLEPALAVDDRVVFALPQLSLGLAAELGIFP